MVGEKHEVFGRFAISGAMLAVSATVERLYRALALYYRFTRRWTRRVTAPRARLALAKFDHAAAKFLKSPAGKRAVEAFRAIDDRRREARDWITESALKGDVFAPPGWVGSITLHLVVVLLMMLTWYARPKIDEQPAAFVPVNLVAVADETNVAPTTKPAARFEPMAIIAPTAPQNLNTDIPSLPQVEVDAEPPPAKLADSPTAPTPTPVDTGQTAPRQDPNQPNVSTQSVQKPASMATPSPSAAPNSKIANRLLPGAGPATESTADLVSLLRSQIEACWSPPVTAARPTQFVIDVEISLNPDGSIGQPPRMVGDSAAAAPHDPAIRAVADALRNAIYRCAPYKLPADLYAQWRDINPLHFDHSASNEP